MEILQEKGLNKMIDLNKEKLKLSYPCSWVYKIVILDKKNMKKIISSILGEREFMIKESKVSSKGKFKSYNLDLIVHHDDDRKTLYDLLGKHIDIKMVL